MDINGLNIAIGFSHFFKYYSKVLDICIFFKKNNCNLFPIISYDDYYDLKEHDKELKIKFDSVFEGKLINDTNLVRKNFEKIDVDILLIVPCSDDIVPLLSIAYNKNPIVYATGFCSNQNKPIVIGLSCNTGLSDNAANIGTLLAKRNYYFVPFRQSNPITKPYSIMFDYTMMIDTVKKALQREQIQPMIL